MVNKQQVSNSDQKKRGWSKKVSRKDFFITGAATAGTLVITATGLGKLVLNTGKNDPDFKERISAFSKQNDAGRKSFPDAIQCAGY